MQLIIEARSRIEALLAEAVVRREDGTVAETFRVYPRHGDFVVRDQSGTIHYQGDRWDLAAERAVALAAEYVSHRSPS